MYRRLESAEITRTALALSDRISARFPGSGLSRVAKELVGVCQDAAQTAAWLARPRKLLRAGVAIGLLVIFVALLGTVLGVRVRMAFTTFSEFVQGLQAGIQNLVFLGIAGSLSSSCSAWTGVGSGDARCPLSTRCDRSPT
jgi:hypothetical protein